MNTLHKAIQRSVENGWGVFGARNVSNGVYELEGDGLRVGFDDVETGGSTIWGKSYSLEQILFDPDFAKALFGEGNKVAYCMVEPSSPRPCNYKHRNYEPFDCLIDYDNKKKEECPAWETIDNPQSGWQYHIQQYAPLSNPDRLKYMREILEAK